MGSLYRLRVLAAQLWREKPPSRPYSPMLRKEIPPRRSAPWEAWDRVRVPCAIGLFFTAVIGCTGCGERDRAHVPHSAAASVPPRPPPVPTSERALQMVSKIVTALAALDRGDRSAALAYLTEARKLADDLSRTRRVAFDPTSVLTEIWAAKWEPIKYRPGTKLSGYLDPAQARVGLGAAQRELLGGDVRRAKGDLNSILRAITVTPEEKSSSPPPVEAQPSVTTS